MGKRASPNFKINKGSLLYGIIYYFLPVFILSIFNPRMGRRAIRRRHGQIRHQGTPTPTATAAANTNRVVHTLLATHPPAGKQPGPAGTTAKAAANGAPAAAAAAATAASRPSGASAGAAPAAAAASSVATAAGVGGGKPAGGAAAAAPPGCGAGVAVANPLQAAPPPPLRGPSPLGPAGQAAAAPSAARHPPTADRRSHQCPVCPHL